MGAPPIVARVEGVGMMKGQSIRLTKKQSIDTARQLVLALIWKELENPSDILPDELANENLGEVYDEIGAIYDRLAKIWEKSRN